MFFEIVVFACFSFGYSEASCNDERDCVSCTNTRSWLPGANCRWCPRDSECHAVGSLVSKCSVTENIKNPADCDKIVFAKYDSNLAYKMVYLSAIAYSNDATKYIPKASEVKTFELVKQVTVSCSGGALCSGFVAVSHSENAIAVAFRGTENSVQLLIEALRVLVEPKRSFQAGGKVQGYFLETFQDVWSDLQKYVYQAIDKYPSYKVWVTGHSLGGTLASLASTLIMFEGKTTKDNLILYTFGQPRVGNYDYARTHDRLVPISFRVTHFRDVVVHLPTCKKIPPGLCTSIGGGPYHHGKEIYYGNEDMAKESHYKICEGLPHNEDISCSNNPLVWGRCFSFILPKCIDDHKRYFGILVGDWWKDHVESITLYSARNSGTKVDGIDRFMLCIFSLIYFLPLLLAE